jgi:hypothetical protein
MTEWQPLTWRLFHNIALNYDNQYKDQYISFFETMKTIIPCKICRDHYNQQLNTMNIQDNMDRIFNWTIDLHNNVNKMNHKRLWSYDEARDYYNVHNFNFGIMKQFIFQYIRLNFKKNPIKTNELFRMLKTLSYFHINIEKKNKLIDFTNKFDLNRTNIKSWIYAFLVILKSI